MDRKVYEYISQHTNDPIVERKTCAITWKEFAIFESNQKFYTQIAPRFGWQQFPLPLPVLCPEERDRRRLSFRNERKLYKRQCSASGKMIVSTYSPDPAASDGVSKNLQIYDPKIRRGDTWNALDYGFVFDANKSFTEQYKQLLYAVPHQALIGANNENADYINLTADSKNCYMVIESSNNEDCYYGYWLQQCKDLADCSYCHACEFSYELQNCRDCAHCRWMTDCQNCHNCDYMYNCHNCRDCIGCVNLVNKQYCINNVQYSEEEYKRIVIASDWKERGDLGDSKIAASSSTPRNDEIINNYHSLTQSSPRQYAHATQTEQSFGDYVHNTKNCVFCYDAYDAEDCRYGEHVRRNAKKVMDVSTVGRDAQRVYECINTGIGATNNLFCVICRSSSNMIYCQECFNCSDCFGCVGLKNKQYCIFNKQYTKEQYEQEVARIISYMQISNEWGYFFHPSLSLYGYNETVAHEQFPLTETTATQLWYTRQHETNTDYSGLQTIDPTTLIKDIQNIDDSILQKILICTQSSKPYRITKQELELYRRLDISIPTLHPDVRHSARLAQRSVRQLHLRICDKSGETILSVYEKNTPFPVYCEDDYRIEIYR